MFGQMIPIMKFLWPSFRPLKCGKAFLKRVHIPALSDETVDLRDDGPQQSKGQGKAKGPAKQASQKGSQQPQQSTEG